MMNQILIPYEAEKFPYGTVSNGRSNLSVTWDDILWAALTIGRPNIYYVFRHRNSSMFEAIFRWSLVRMALEQRGPYLCRTDAVRLLDPTEKGAVNYFLGMVFCKLFATKLLNTPWLLHLDVFRPQLNPRLLRGSRPDLVGEEHNIGTWYSFECKGRSRSPDSSVKEKAKNQALRLVSVDGINCSLHIGAVTYYHNDVLQFYWCDPEQDDLRKIEIPYYPKAWRFYYEPAASLVKRDRKCMEKMSYEIGLHSEVPEADIQLSIHPTIAEFIFRKEWESARKISADRSKEFGKTGYQLDGISVTAGDSWHMRYED